jgi:hypothetical protein
MPDVLAIAGVVVAFVLLGLMAAGCDRIIGPAGEDLAPGGEDAEGTR